MDLAASLRHLERSLTGEPRTEAALQDLLAASIKESEGLELDFESPTGTGERIDLLVRPDMAGIEIKYHKPIPSGHNRPMTQQYGALLADARKLASDNRLSERYLVLITDRPGYTHVVNRNLLPTSYDRSKPITGAKVRGLAATASGRATGSGDWIDVEVHMIWQSKAFGPDRMSGFAWSLSPILT